MKVLELKVVRKREYVLFATEVILYNKREVTKLQYLLLMIAQYRRREGALLLEVGREERTKLRSRYWASSFIGDQGERRYDIHFANNSVCKWP